MWRAGSTAADGPQMSSDAANGSPLSEVSHHTPVGVQETRAGSASYMPSPRPHCCAQLWRGSVSILPGRMHLLRTVLPAGSGPPFCLKSVRAVATHPHPSAVELYGSGALGAHMELEAVPLSAPGVGDDVRHAAAQ